MMLLEKLDNQGKKLKLNKMKTLKKLKLLTQIRVHRINKKIQEEI